jgi:hypothetical protein
MHFRHTVRINPEKIKNNVQIIFLTEICITSQPRKAVFPSATFRRAKMGSMRDVVGTGTGIF